MNLILTKLTFIYILTLISIRITSNRGNTTLLVIKAFITLIGLISSIIRS